MNRRWVLVDRPLALLRDPDALNDVTPVLDQLVVAFGAKAVARLIGASPAAISSWQRHESSVNLDLVRRILDLYYILSRAFKAFQPRTVMRCLVASDPFLEEQRPIDVLALDGPSRVIAAIDAHEAGSYP